MRRGWLAAAALAAVTATPAYADHAPALRSQVVDETGSTGQRARDAVAELLDERDVQLYALFVTSTGGASGPAYARSVADENGLGGNDALLVVAPSEGRYGLWTSPGLLRSDVTRTFARRVEPELRQGDWDGAVETAADTLGDAVAGRSSGSGSANSARLLLLLLAGAGLGWYLWQRARVRRARRAEEAERVKRYEQVAGEAAVTLIRLDERLRDAETEVRLAGMTSDDPDASATYERLAKAREHVRVAFELRAREEVSGPDADLLDQVLAECRAAEELLGAVTARTAELRDLQQHAPETLAALGTRIESVERGVGAAETTLAALRERVAETVRTVEGNLPEARKRLDYARTEVAAGLRLLDAHDLPNAALRARLAEQSVARAEQLVEAVRHVERAVSEAQAALPDALRQAERAVAAARDVAAPKDDRVARAETALRQARAERDVVVAVRLAAEASALAEPVSGAAAERRGVLDGAITSARAAYTSAEDFIAARREGVGERPRARLLMAERDLRLAESVRETDPSTALEAARRAEELSYQAYELAAEDFDRLERYDTPYGGGLGGFGGFGGFGMPLPLPIPIIIGGGGGWGGAWGGGWDGGWGDSSGGDFGGDFGDSFGGTF